MMRAALPVPMSGRAQADVTVPSAPVTPRKRICGGRTVETTRIDTWTPARGFSVSEVVAFSVSVTLPPDMSSASDVSESSRCSDAASDAR